MSENNPGDRERSGRPLLRPSGSENSQVKGIIFAAVISFLLGAVAAAGVFWFLHSPEKPLDEENLFTPPPLPSSRNAATLPTPEQISILASKTDAAIADARWGDAITTANAVLSLLESKIPREVRRKYSDPAELKKKWSRSMLGALEKQKLEPEMAKKIAEACMAWNPSFGKAIADSFIWQAKTHLNDSEKTSLSNGVAMLQEAISLNRDLSEQAGELAWKEMAKRLYNPQGFNRNTFIKLHALSQQFGLPERIRAQSTYQLAESLMEYQSGNRAQAIARLRALAQDSSDPAAMRFARRVLAPPRQGSRPLQAPPYSMKDSKGREAIQIAPAMIRISARAIELSFRVQNVSGQTQGILFGRKNPDIADAAVPELLRIVDDLDVERFSSEGFVGGEQQDYNREGTLRLIAFEPGTETRITAKFPMVSPGATSIRFLSPKYAGQSSWWWDDIPIKEGPFDPPLELGAGALTNAEEAVTPPAEFGSSDAGIGLPALDLEPPKLPDMDSIPSKPQDVAPDEDEELPEFQSNPDREADEASRQEGADSGDLLDLSEPTPVVMENPEFAEMEATRKSAQNQRSLFLAKKYPRNEHRRYENFGRGEEFLRMAQSARGRRNYLAATAYFREAEKAYSDARAED